MSIGWVIFFVVVLVAAYFVLRRQSTTSESDVEAKPLTTMAGLGFGIIILGLLVLLMPSTSARIADLPNVQSEAYAILVGISYLLGIFVVLAGIAVLFVREKNE
jgi:cytochrome bd-type quinol oxidase subunit 2